MTDWTAEARQLYKKEHPENFAGPDLSFPIKDEADVKNAWDLAGHGSNPTATRSKIKSIAKKLGLSHSLPASANMSEDFIRSGDTAIFAIGEGLEKNGNVYTRTGKIFEVGDYPDKDFSLSVEEARAAVAAFKPLPNRGAHVPTIFDGKMGMLEKIELAEDGLTINGTLSIPEWLQTLHGPENVLMGSLEWDRETKMVAGSTLIPNPRVADSALMAAFTTAEGAKNSSRTVSFMDALRTMLGLDEPPETVPPVVTPPVKVKEKAEMGTENNENPEILALRQQVEQLERRNRTNEAERLSAALFADRRVLPAQMKALTAVFETALGLDQTASVVTFANEAGAEQKMNIVEAVKAVFAAGPQHNLTLELVPSNPNLMILGNSAETVDKEDPDGSKASATSARAWAKRNEGQKSGS